MISVADEGRSVTADFQSRSSAQGEAFERHVARVLTAKGYDIVYRHWRHPEVDVEVDFVVTRQGDEGATWVEAKGSWESDRNGLVRTDTVKKAIGSAYLLSLAEDRCPYVIVTSDPPAESSVGAEWLRKALADGTVAAVWTLPLDFEEWK